MEITINKPKSTNPKLVNPCIDTDTIAQKLAQGESQFNIATKYNVTQQRISQISKENKHLVDKYKAILIDNYAPKYIDRAINENEYAHSLVCNTDTYIPTEDNERFLSRQDRKGDKILESIGILQSRTNLNNFGSIQVNQQANTVISQNITRLVGKSVSKQLEELSDADVTDVSSDEV